MIENFSTEAAPSEEADRKKIEAFLDVLEGKVIREHFGNAGELLRQEKNLIRNRKEVLDDLGKRSELLEECSRLLSQSEQEAERGRDVLDELKNSPLLESSVGPLAEILVERRANELNDLMKEIEGEREAVQIWQKAN